MQEFTQEEVANIAMTCFLFGATLGYGLMYVIAVFGKENDDE